MALQFGVSYLGSELHFVKVRRWPFRIGRSPSCDLSLTNSSKISRRHATLRREAEGYQLTIYGSNPTYLNGVKVQVDSTIVIQHGDCLELPEYRLEVRDTADFPVDKPLATEILQQCDDTNIVERKVASALGIRKWSAAGIHDWLSASRQRLIVIRHPHIELRLAFGVPQEQLQQRLNAFNQLLDFLDLQELSIRVEDPSHGNEPDLRQAYA